MPRFWTKDSTTLQITFNQVTYTVTVPKHTRCRKITLGSTAGQYRVDDLSWIDPDSMLYLDAYYKGIVLPPDQVEEVS